ncbi:trigger factor [Desulfitobacterium sp. PCE1]|uniref:trigger factor n=1 Tax=Desulfitobacterium sp. PCE1 TaxID=146907 RepID=UPI00037CD7CE|nr:trigger factor [Desulfitobacterium sp. PCE1]
MNAVLEKIENSEAYFQFMIDYKLFEDTLEKTYKKNRKNYEVSGFRKGTVPRSVLESKYGAEMFYQEALDLVIPKEYYAAVKELKLNPVGDPDIEVGYIEKGKELSVKVSVPVVPEVVLGKIEGLEINVPKQADVMEADIDKYLENLRLNNKKVTDKEQEPVAIGDTVTVDYDCKMDGTTYEPVKDYKALVDVNESIMSFEDRLIGAKKGDIVTIEKKFPQDHPNFQLAGKTAYFKATIKKVERIEVLSLDDNFAQEIGKVNTIEDLRIKAKKDLEEMAAQRVIIQRNQEILKGLIQICSVTVPDSLIMKRAMSMMEQFSQELQAQGGTVDLYLQMMNIKGEDFKKQVWEDAKNSLQSQYIIDKIIQEKGFTACEEELNQYIEKFALSVGMAAENAKENLGPLVNKVEYDVKAEKAFQYVVDNAVIAILE